MSMKTKIVNWKWINQVCPVHNNAHISTTVHRIWLLYGTFRLICCNINGVWYAYPAFVWMRVLQIIDLLIPEEMITCDLCVCVCSRVSPESIALQFLLLLLAHSLVVVDIVVVVAAVVVVAQKEMNIYFLFIQYNSLATAVYGAWFIR